MRTTTMLLGFLALAGGIALAQAPTGTIAGTVTDESGASIPGAKITISNPETGLRRALTTDIEGRYSAPLLAAGSYEVRAEAAAGFRPAVRRETVETGRTTTVDFSLQVGPTNEVVTVADLAPRIDYENPKIGGVVTRSQIEDLPLNGRDFLQLSGLEPGVTAAASSGGRYNREFDVSMLGADHRKTRVTVDGGDVLDHITGGTGQNFSQEIVQEFQTSSVNLDPSTGITAAGAINIVTRSGGNSFHGSGYYFFRDSSMAAYPGLGREPLNPGPFFARRQSGFYVGGPIRKDRVFFFTNLEHNNQDAVFTVQPRSPEFARFGRISPSPFTGTQISARFDFHLNRNNTAFLRYSHDGNNAFGPLGLPNLPSNWTGNKNWADQSIGGLTTVFGPRLVNELRFSYTYWQNRRRQPTPADCPAPCLGLGLPQIEVLGANFAMGNTIDAPQGRDTRRYHTTESLAWERGSHRLRSGLEWTHYSGTGFWAFLEPAAMALYPPEIVRLYNSVVPPALQVRLPASFNTIEDIWQLPLVAFQTGIGDPSQPPLFNLDQAKQSNRWRFHFQDMWRVHPQFSLNYGLAYAYETNLLNHDLSKPDYLGPILGAGGLAPSRKDRSNWGPSAGFAWNVSKNNKTVVRGGAGIYYDTHLFITRLVERSIVGPWGNGRFPIGGSFVPNPIPGLPTVPLLSPLDFRAAPTQFTGAHLLAILPLVRAGLEQQLSSPSNTDLSLRNIEVFKQGRDLITRDFTTPYSEHVSIGAQRQITRELVVSADFVFRQLIHENMEGVDYNHWDSVRGPVLPRCVGLQALDPRARCSNGPIEVLSTGGRSHYKGLLVRVDKRFSGRTQFLASYALSKSAGFNTIVNGMTGIVNKERTSTGPLNKDNWFDNFGPLDTDRRHILTLSGVIDLRWGLRAGFISTVATRAPFSAWVSGLDFNGDGADNDLLPGTRVHQFNRSAGKEELQRALADFDQRLAGTRTPRGQAIPHLALPSQFDFGDNFVSQDLRLSRTFKYAERFRLTLLGEVFNLFNVANLSGYSGNLAEPASIGQPTNRVTQVFGSGGPRAFQLGVRLTF